MREAKNGLVSFNVLHCSKVETRKSCKQDVNFYMKAENLPMQLRYKLFMPVKHNYSILVKGSPIHFAVMKQVIRS